MFLIYESVSEREKKTGEEGAGGYVVLGYVFFVLIWHVIALHKTIQSN